MKRKNLKKATPAAQPKNRDVVTLRLKASDDPVKAEAALGLRPTVQAGATIRAYSKGKDGSGPDTDALIDELRAQVEAVAKGDLRRPEAILVAQAHALDAMFGYLARRAVKQEYLAQYEAHLRLALRAQAQCARTLEVLGNLKNPAPVAFVRQANIGNAVQVNNGPQPRAQDKIPNQSNELLTTQHGEHLERLPAQTAGAADSTLEAMDAINRPEDT